MSLGWLMLKRSPFEKVLWRMQQDISMGILWSGNLRLLHHLMGEQHVLHCFAVFFPALYLTRQSSASFPLLHQCQNAFFLGVKEVVAPDCQEQGWWETLEHSAFCPAENLRCFPPSVIEKWQELGAARWGQLPLSLSLRGSAAVTAPSPGLIP